jgi:sugar phosphate isomerase/epimerase
MKRLAETGHDLGVTFLIENLMHDCPLGHDPVQLAEQIMEVNSPRIRMCFDTGHAHATLSRFAAAKRGAVAVALRICAPAVSYLHIHDNDGVHDQHLMPGRGGKVPSSPTGVAGEGIDWPAVAQALRGTESSATRMLEVFEDPDLSGNPGEFAPRLRDWLAISSN